MSDNDGVVKTNSAEIKRRTRSDKGKPHAQKKQVTVADLKGVPKNELGQIEEGAEVTPEQFEKLGGFDAQSMIEAEELKRMGHGEKIQIGEKSGPAGWDYIINVVKTLGLWPRGRVDIKSLYPPEDYQPIPDVGSVPDGPSLYAYLVRVHSRDVPTKIQCTYVEGQAHRYRCLFTLPARQQQQQQQQQPYGQQPPPPGGWPPPQYPGAGYPPPPQPPGYAYSPWQPPAQLPAGPPAPPAPVAPAAIQGMSPEQVSQMMAERDAAYFRMMEWTRSQQPQQAPLPPAPQQPSITELMTAMTSMFSGMILPLMQANGTAPNPAAAPPKSLLEQGKEMVEFYRMSKEISGDTGEKPDDSKIGMMDGPGDTKIPFNKDTGDIPKGMAMWMGISAMAEKIEKAVAPIGMLHMQRAQMEMEQVKQQQNLQVQTGLPNMPILATGVQTQATTSVDEDDETDPL